MPLIILSILIQAALVIHVIKTGRNTLWIWVVIILPLVGTIAYLAIEILPQILGSRAARRVLSSAKRSIDPTRDLRHAHRRLRMNDSIDSRRHLAEQLFDNGQYKEAAEYYRQTLTGLYENDPHLLLGLAHAQFALGEATPSRETLGRLIKENPGFKSADGHLLYARALEAEGNANKALEEFETLVKYYPGAEATYRYSQLLRKSGDSKRAQEILTQLLNDAELATKFYRKEQKEWLTLAKRDVQGL